MPTVVDSHVHVIVPEITRGPDGPDPWRPEVRWEDGRQVVTQGGRSIRSALGDFVDVDAILATQAAAGIDHVVLSPWVRLLGYERPVGEALAAARVQNEALSRLAGERPGRVSALGTVPLQDPAVAAEEVRRVMDLPGLRGVEITASVCGLYLGDPCFEPFWGAAEATGAVVFVHPTTRGFDLPALNDHYLWMPAMTGKDSCRTTAKAAPTAALMIGTSVSRISPDDVESVFVMTMFPETQCDLTTQSYYTKVLDDRSHKHPLG